MQCIHANACYLRAWKTGDRERERETNELPIHSREAENFIKLANLVSADVDNTRVHRQPPCQNNIQYFMWWLRMD